MRAHTSNVLRAGLLLIWEKGPREAFSDNLVGAPPNAMPPALLLVYLSVEGSSEDVGVEVLPTVTQRVR